MSGYEVLGTCDDNDTCDCCGRTGLTVTVALRDPDGEQVFFGRSCAARAAGWKTSHLDRQIFAAQAKVDLARELIERWSRYVRADGTVDTDLFIDVNRDGSGAARFTADQARERVTTLLARQAGIVAPLTRRATLA